MLKAIGAMLFVMCCIYSCANYVLQFTGIYMGSIEDWIGGDCTYCRCGDRSYSNIL